MLSGFEKIKHSPLKKISIDDWLSLTRKQQKLIERAIRDKLTRRGISRRAAIQVSRKLKRKALKLSGPRKTYSKEVLVWRYKPDSLLDSLYAHRLRDWKIVPRRRVGSVIDVNKFSIIDNPVRTLNIIKEIVRGECSEYDAIINFNDERVQDISPYLLLSIVYRRMNKYAMQGGLKPAIGKVLRAVGLDQHMQIAFTKDIKPDGVFAFPVQMLQVGSLQSDNIATQVSRREKVTGDLVECINDWLSLLEPPFALTPEAEANLADSVGEMLCNAERHSQHDTSGGWWIAGFMAHRFDAQTGHDRYVCHISAISLGETMAGSLLDSDPANDRFWPAFNDYSSFHPGLSKELAATILACQDGVSRIGPDESQSEGGFGIQDLIQNIAIFGAGRGRHKAGVCFISGRCCLRFSDPFLYDANTNDGQRRYQWFNDEQDPKVAPSSEHATDLDFFFPGTLIAIRFELDQIHMDEAINGSNNPDQP